MMPTLQQNGLISAHLAETLGLTVAGKLNSHTLYMMTE